MECYFCIRKRENRQRLGDRGGFARNSDLRHDGTTTLRVGPQTEDGLTRAHPTEQSLIYIMYMRTHTYLYINLIQGTAPSYEGRGLEKYRLFIYYPKDGKQKQRRYLVWTQKGVEFIFKLINH